MMIFIMCVMIIPLITNAMTLEWQPEEYLAAVMLCNLSDGLPNQAKKPQRTKMKCPDCKMLISIAKGLRYHKEVDVCVPLKQYPCWYRGCERSFDYKPSLLHHQEFNHGICRLCRPKEVVFKDLLSLQDHNAKEHERMIHFYVTCDRCSFKVISGKSADNLRALARHRESVHE